MKFRKRSCYTRRAKLPRCIGSNERSRSLSAQWVAACLQNPNPLRRLELVLVVFPSSSWYSSSLLEAADLLISDAIFRWMLRNRLQMSHLATPTWHFWPALGCVGGTEETEVLCLFSGRSVLANFFCNFAILGEHNSLIRENHHLREKWSDRWNLLSRNGIQISWQVS